MASLSSCPYLRPALSWFSRHGSVILKIEDQDRSGVWIEVSLTSQDLWSMYSQSVPEPVPVPVADLPDLVDLPELPGPELPDIPTADDDEFPFIQ